MARTQDSTPKAKEPGRLKQMYQVFQMTRRYDSVSIWYLLIAFLGPAMAGIALALLLARDNIVNLVSFIVAGVLGGVLLFLIVLGRRAEKAAYSQLTGQQGAVGAVLKTALRRGWQASEFPVAVSQKTHDAVYRAVGRGGVALIGEGPRSRTQRMLEDERRAVMRILPNVPVNFLYVGPDPDSIPLHKLATRLRLIKPALRKPEVLAVANRLNSLGKTGIPIPKGVDPQRVRAQRPR
jgi:hypothetical protein